MFPTKQSFNFIVSGATRASKYRWLSDIMPEYDPVLAVSAAVENVGQAKDGQPPYSYHAGPFRNLNDMLPFFDTDMAAERSLRASFVEDMICYLKKHGLESGYLLQWQCQKGLGCHQVAKSRFLHWSSSEREFE